MASKHSSQDEFFKKLEGLFSHRHGQDHGSVQLTQKRLTQNTSSTSNEAGDLSDLVQPTPLPVLIRATNGKSKDNRSKKVKMSTIVQPDDLEAFYVRYADVCKAGMTALKKRDRKGRKAKKKGKGNAATATAT